MNPYPQEHVARSLIGLHGEMSEGEEVSRWYLDSAGGRSVDVLIRQYCWRWSALTWLASQRIRRELGTLWLSDQAILDGTYRSQPRTVESFSNEAEMWKLAQGLIDDLRRVETFALGAASETEKILALALGQ